LHSIPFCINVKRIFYQERDKEVQLGMVHKST
jgi:hypothetical protein